MREICSFIQSNLAVEMRLILACLRVTPNAKEARQIKGLSRTDIAWPEFLRWVDRHRVAPLVYTNLSRYGGKTVPSAVMSALRFRYEKNARRGLANAAETVRLCQLFQENVIPVLPLKGSVLALQVYGNLALRHAGDIDLLVEPNKMERAHLLLQASYRRIEPDLLVTPSQHRRLLRLLHHFKYLHDQGNLRVELHWRLLDNQPPRGLDLARLASRVSSVMVAGSRLPAISLSDNLLYLCAHGGAHFWSRLFWLVDLSEMMRANPAVDWQHLLALAGKAGVLRPLAQGVILAHGLLDVPLPEAIRAYVLQDQLVFYLARVAYRSMLRPQPETRPFFTSLLHYQCRIRCAHSFEDKLQIFHEILLGKDWKNFGLPSSLYILYYFLRPLLWLHRNLQRSWNQA